MAARNREASRASRAHSRPPRGPPIPRAVPVSNQNDELYQFTSLKFEFLNFDRSELNIRTINSKKPNYIQGLSLNPFWQILENSSRNFPEISVFRGVTQTDFWKTHPVFFRNLNFRGMSWIQVWMSFQKSVCVTLRKTEISGKFLDEFSRICQ